VVLGVAAAPFAYAQTPRRAAPNTARRVVITGIRASDFVGGPEAQFNRRRRRHRRRDIGKFPDTNLAESMQRITGVSIDRVNGEVRR